MCAHNQSVQICAIQLYNNMGVPISSVLIRGALLNKTYPIHVCAHNTSVQICAIQLYNYNMCVAYNV